MPKKKRNQKPDLSEKAVKERLLNAQQKITEWAKKAVKVKVPGP